MVSDGVLGQEGADAFGDGEDELVGFFRGGVVERGVVGGVFRLDDGGVRVAGAAGEALPELLGEEGHEGVDHGEAGFEGGVEGVDGGVPGVGVAVADEGLGVFDVDVAEVGVPVLVCDGGGGGEFAVGEGVVDFLGGDGHLV